ncbi:alpha-hydroxy acid oxidase, partial [Flavisphingomonas formosensis]|uniref:alpha-hydroxy acid oxidase n=1 Tax=Flavisphingomonas formosensis TaxID=861534 RepID=UPI0018DF729A
PPAAPAPPAPPPLSLFDYIGGQFDRTVTWRDLEWLASEWSGPLAVKGIMTPADAKRSIASGASGVIVSNHGGRQLDGVPAPIHQIAAVRDALGDGPDVICDGGIRRGSDVVKAIALGATACAIGRLYLYGLAAAGEKGVDRVLALLTEEVERTMILSGVAGIGGLEGRHVRNFRRG